MQIISKNGTVQATVLAGVLTDSLKMSGVTARLNNFVSFLTNKRKVFFLSGVPYMSVELRFHKPLRC